MHRVRTQTASCAQVSASSPPHYSPGAEGSSSSEEPAGIFPAGTWEQGLGLCVCPPTSFLSFSAKGHGRDSQPCLFAVWSLTETQRRRRPVWVFMNSGTHSPGSSNSVIRAPSPGVSAWRCGPEFQVTWSKKMPVWHPHRQWWIWWTWRVMPCGFAEVLGSHTFLTDG